MKGTARSKDVFVSFNEGWSSEYTRLGQTMPLGITLHLLIKFGLF